MRGWGLAGPQHKKGTSHDTHCARGAGASQLHGGRHGRFRAGRSGHEPCAADTADREYDDHHVSGQLRHASDELPEFLPSDHRGGGDKSCGVNEYRRLQSQLHDATACLQTAVLKEASRDDEKLARGFTFDMRIDLIHGGKARLAPRRLGQLVDCGGHARN